MSAAERGDGPSSPALPAPLETLLRELETLDRTGRLEQLLAWADEFVEVPAEVAMRPYPERNHVPHCESEVHGFAVDRPDGTLDFHFAVGNRHGVSARAWATVLVRGCSGQPLEQVAVLPEELIARVFGPALSMGKDQGLSGMLELVRHAARARLAARRTAPVTRA